MPEPRRRLTGPSRLFEQLRLRQQALVAKQGAAASLVVVAPGDLDQAAPAIQLPIAIGLGCIAQAQGQAAGVVARQIAVIAQFLDVAELSGFMADLGDERRHTPGIVDFPARQGDIEC